MELTDGNSIIQYLEEFDDISAVRQDALYIVKKSQGDDPDRMIEFKNAGFVFLDRLLCAEINLKASYELRQDRMKELPGLSFYDSSEFTKDMFDMACRQYTKDRRFHLKDCFDDVLAADIINIYSKHYMNCGGKLYLSNYNGALSGYIMYVQKGDSFENVLGVTAPGLPGKASAYALYSKLMDKMLEEGYKNYKGWVSSSNIASINLHIKLGASVTRVIDEYIMRRK